MDATGLFIIGILITGILAVAGIFAVALRREPSAGPVTVEECDQRARAADEAARARKAKQAEEQAQQAAGDAVVATLVEAPPEIEAHPEPLADPLTDQIEVTASE